MSEETDFTREQNAEATKAAREQFAPPGGPSLFRTVILDGQEYVEIETVKAWLDRLERLHAAIDSEHDDGAAVCQLGEFLARTRCSL